MQGMPKQAADLSRLPGVPRRNHPRPYRSADPVAAPADTAVRRAALTPGGWAALVAPTACIAAATVLLGVAAGPLFALAERAAAQLSDPSQYVRVVLGDGDRP